MSGDERIDTAAELERALRVTAGELAADAAQAPDCVDPSQLAALAAGALDEAERKRLLDHVGNCSYCLLGMDAALEELESASEPARPRWGLVLVLAAAAVVVVVLGRGLLAPPEAIDVGSRLVALARVEPLDLRVTRGIDEAAVALYVDGDYEACGRLLSSREELDDLGRLLLASVEWLEGRPAQALAAAEPLAGADGTLAREATWIAAQASLALGDGATAAARLESLADTEGARAEEARALVAELAAVLD